MSPDTFKVWFVDGGEFDSLMLYLVSSEEKKCTEYFFKINISNVSKTLKWRESFMSDLTRYRD